jgi:hypothetical protein
MEHGPVLKDQVRKGTAKKTSRRELEDSDPDKVPNKPSQPVCYQDVRRNYRTGNTIYEAFIIMCQEECQGFPIMIIATY